MKDRRRGISRRVFLGGLGASAAGFRAMRSFIASASGAKMKGAAKGEDGAHPPSSPFIDRLRPMPVHDGLESDLWGREFVVPRDADNGMEDPEWAYWGGDVIKGPQGRYHMFVARWPREGGHNAWRAATH